MARRFPTLAQALAARRLRPAIYALLACVIGCGAALSFTLESTTAQVRASSAPWRAATGDAGREPAPGNIAPAIGGDIERDIARITRMVHLFNLFALATAAFMIWQLRERFRSEDELAHQAGHDPLTGLPDRRSLDLALQRLGPDLPATLVLGTIDRFGAVIGSYGHGFGDRMIQSMVARIDTMAQLHGGQPYRLDGANIAVLYRLGRDDLALLGAVEALLRSVRTPFAVDGHEVFSSLSLGLAGTPQDGADAAALLRHGGGDRALAYSAGLNARSAQRLELETALRRAIERGQLELHYQPQQRLADGALVGFEALLRWRHDERQVSPADFIPLAEASGLIVQIGEWVLQQACRQAVLWRAAGAPPLVVAVNVSPRQFAQPGFADMVRRTLRTSGAPPAAIELEITEGVMVEGGERAEALLRSLRALGLKLSIDDFGTGHSSLAYLKRFAIHKLKIDQSFVRALDIRAGGEAGCAGADAAIVQAVIGLGHNLGLQVIAEGVETSAQRCLLCDWGCDQIQGYHYGRPMDAAAATAFIADAAGGADAVADAVADAKPQLIPDHTQV
ncbi:bifunctional diguanylate cyclase/phosphodiesterase [Massilia sp.]|uniref:putative bifunctional diguanylate cyclase/phosphodiesterase n=1 Tax=Massilia sp. TaxID=1882437 RepID=UPI00289B571E|nr:bifunctional diguanylate cyclase/phosphodiesterase [Massilia sp.]